MMQESSKSAQERFERPLASAPTSELLAQLAKDSADLIKKEVELAKTELRGNLHRELRAASDLAIAALFGLLTLNALMVAAIVGLSASLPAWAAALIVATVVLAIAVVVGAVGWKNRVTRPLARTKKTLRDDIRWAKRHLT